MKKYVSHFSRVEGLSFEAFAQDFESNLDSHDRKE